MKHLSENQLTLAYFEEAPEADRAHLGECTRCRAEYERLAHFLDAMRAAPAPERADGWERRVWTQMAPRVIPVLEHGRSPFRYWIWGPALAAVVALAFLAGMYTQRRATPSGFSPRARERVLLIAMGDHLDRSQIVLAELANAPEGKPADISAEQQLAGNLIGENRLLRQTAARSGDTGDAAVLEQLERVLIDVSHSPSEISSEEMDNLRQRIEAGGLLFKVRVISTNAREKGMKL